MFGLSLTSPNGYPTLMGIYASMTQAFESMKVSCDRYQIKTRSPVYIEGEMYIKGSWYNFTIIQCELSLKIESIFRE